MSSFFTSKNVKVAFLITFIIGFLMEIIPLYYDGVVYQRCLESLEVYRRQHACNYSDVIYSFYGISNGKLLSVGVMILGVFLMSTSTLYLIGFLINRAFYNLRNKRDAKNFNVKKIDTKDLLEMKKLLDENVITIDEFELFKKSSISKK